MKDRKGRKNSILNDVQNNSFIGNLMAMLFLPISLVYMEILAKLKIFGSVFDGEFIYLLVLSLAMGFLISMAAMLLSGRLRGLFIKTMLAVLAVWFSFHISYFCNFHTFFSWQSLGQAKDITQFWREAIVAALNVWYVIVGFFVPFVIACSTGFLFLHKDSRRSIPFSGISFAAFAFLFFPTVLYINHTRTTASEYTPYYYYTYLQNDLESSFRYFGIVNATRLDIKQLIFGEPTEHFSFDDVNVSRSDHDPSQNDVQYDWNVMDIDFDKAAASTKSEKLKAMDEYFKTVQPTRKNEYTGIFKGKNLIFITLEGFSDKVIDAEFTPTLYKMATEGFVFRNYYNTVWGGSTGSGEYANLTGNFYLNSSCLVKSSETYQPFVLGNQLSALGYKTLGYHNNTYKYYGRNLSHPNFGYKWIGLGNGLVLKSKCWPNSDKEMAEATVGDYSGLDQPFHVYYITVSGHANYSFNGNMMSTIHMRDIPEKYKGYSHEVKAYLACQYEVELMLQVLVNELEKSGKLQDTVFAMTADHYPYALSDEGLAQLYDLKKSGIRNNFDLYRNAFILWCPSMKEPVTVDTLCSAIDIMPTISNMFDLSYDSRLIMGCDIMADCDHSVLLKVGGWSWISSQGSYRAWLDSFRPSEGCTLSETEQKDYVKRMNKMVKAKTSFSKQMLENDYYGHIFGKK